jgi:hypothetical protein
VALQLNLRGDDPGTAGAVADAVAARIAALPRAQPGFEIASTGFLRSRAEQRPRNTRAVLIEYRFRLLSTETLP